jgi:hypothetical protein
MECVICLEDITLDNMITTETSYKLAEIIRDTWPGLYRLTKDTKNSQNLQSPSKMSSK